MSSSSCFIEFAPSLLLKIDGISGARGWGEGSRRNKKLLRPPTWGRKSNSSAVPPAIRQPARFLGASAPPTHNGGPPAHPTACSGGGSREKAPYRRLSGFQHPALSEKRTLTWDSPFFAFYNIAPYSTTTGRQLQGFFSVLGKKEPLPVGQCH